MNDPYRWDYKIRIKTKEGSFEYEDNLENIDTILQQHQNYEEVRAEHNKPKSLVKRRNDETRKFKKSN